MASQPVSHHQSQPSISSSAASPASPVPPTPAASTNAGSTSTHLSSKPQRILACVLCQHRKIKCDRTFPCANCLKANVTCTPSTPAPARKRRRPNQDLQERLARCEELLKAYATAKPESPPETKASSPKPTDRVPELADPLAKWKPAGKLVEDFDGVRFMDSYMLTTVYDELKSMRKIVDEEIACDEPTPMPTDEAADTPDENAELIFGAIESPASNPEDLTPSASHIFLLWQIYLDRCNPLTKIIHVPTVQAFVLEAQSESPQLAKNVEALLFAIYLLATVSLRKTECREMLGMSRDKALARFSNGVRITLSRMGFLKTHDLITLQALVIYLISLQGRYNRHASWILNGLVIRIAQKMGLHRDGELLGLKPFETEMRRRLWWQIIMVDAKYAMLSGLSHTLLPRGWDTKEPKNISDQDLQPSATAPIKDVEGPTDMILIVVFCKIAKALINLPGIETILLLNELEATRGPSGPNKQQVQMFEDTVKKLEADMKEIFERFSSPDAGPLHVLAQHLQSHLMGKLSAIGNPPGAQADWGTEVFDHTSNTFKLAVETTAHAVDQYKMDTYPGWDWYARLHFQLDVFAYLVGQLRHRTTGPLVDKAWNVVEDVYKYHPEFYDVGSGHGYYQIAHFVFKAWRKREEVLRAHLGREPEVPKCVVKLRSLVNPEDMSVKSESGRTPLAGPGSLFNFDASSSSGQGGGGAAMPGGGGSGGGGSGMMDFGGGDGAPFDAFMGGYFDDYNGALDFDIWGNPTPSMPSTMPTTNPLDPMSQQQQQPPITMNPSLNNQQLGGMMGYGVMGQNWK